MSEGNDRIDGRLREAEITGYQGFKAYFYGMLGEVKGNSGQADCPLIKPRSRIRNLKNKIPESLLIQYYLRLIYRGFLRRTRAAANQQATNRRYVRQANTERTHAR